MWSELTGIDTGATIAKLTRKLHQDAGPFLPRQYQDERRPPAELTIDGAMAFLNPSDRLWDIAYSTVSLMLRGIVRTEVDSAAITLHRALDKQGKVNLCKLAFHPQIECSNWLRCMLLKASWMLGMATLPKKIVGHHGFNHDELFGWFDRIDFEPHMFPTERAAYDALPDEFTIYRGAGAPTIEKGASSFSWSRDIHVASWYALRGTELHDLAPWYGIPRSQVPEGRNMLLAAEVSKSAVYWCHCERRLDAMMPPRHRPGDALTETEVVIDYRQIRNLRETSKAKEVGAR